MYNLCISQRFFNVFPSVQIRAAKNSHAVFPLNILRRSDKLCVFYCAFDLPQIKTIRHFLKQFSQLLQPLSQLRISTQSVPTKVPEFGLSIIHLHITTVNSKFDVQHRWHCVLVTSVRAVRHHVTSFLQ
jgi:hypothetical protein